MIFTELYGSDMTHPTPHPPVDIARIARIGTQLQTLSRELSEIFPQREQLIQQFIYALLTREHVLMFGPYGTGKSDLVNTLFDALVGGKRFEIALSRFMSEANLIGIPDPRMMREEGVVHYRREGGILDADFVELDELLDSNAPLLRVLLGILNERVFKRGRQVEAARLHTAIASTNGDPDIERKRQPTLGAVLDRFLFHARVDYLQTAAHRHQMYTKYLGGLVPDTQLSLEDLQYISSICVSARQISDQQIIVAYDQLITGYRNASGQPISDRRACKLLQLIEASALLHGRFDVHPEDLDAVRWGLCVAHDAEQHQHFDTVITPIIAHLQGVRAEATDAPELLVLENCRAQMPAGPFSVVDPTLIDKASTLRRLYQQVRVLRPKLPSTAMQQQELLLTLKAHIDTISQSLFGTLEELNQSELDPLEESPAPEAG